MNDLEEKNLPSSTDQKQEETQQLEEPPWPTNGGPLGCLLGAIAGVLIGGFLGTTLLIPYRFVGITLTILLMIGLAILGWQIGRKIFREYKPPKQGRRMKK
jgi:predicted lipid-binding transport protein (Tim44 family)